MKGFWKFLNQMLWNQGKANIERHRRKGIYVHPNESIDTVHPIFHWVEGLGSGGQSLFAIAKTRVLFLCPLNHTATFTGV